MCSSRMKFIPPAPPPPPQDHAIPVKDGNASSSEDEHVAPSRSKRVKKKSSKQLRSEIMQQVAEDRRILKEVKHPIPSTSAALMKEHERIKKMHPTKFPVKRPRVTSPSGPSVNATKVATVSNDHQNLNLSNNKDAAQSNGAKRFKFNDEVDGDEDPDNIETEPEENDEEDLEGKVNINSEIQSSQLPVLQPTDIIINDSAICTSPTRPILMENRQRGESQELGSLNGSDLQSTFCGNPVPIQEDTEFDGHDSQRQRSNKENKTILPEAKKVKPIEIIVSNEVPVPTTPVLETPKRTIITRRMSKM